MLRGFKQFLMRGNVIDLAVAVVIGAAFGAVVTALVKDLITPLIAAIVGKPDFSAIVFEINGSKFLIGGFINALVSFLLVSVSVRRRARRTGTRDGEPCYLARSGILTKYALDGAQIPITFPACSRRYV
jgi:hypothetical protein